ncbi:hypothetical protein C0J52_25372 [Blattella germanica]|nr:hypothetical protein C0J52_25372 [Blattella germanica]
MVQAVDEIISRDLPQAIQLLREMNENVLQVIQLVDNMLERVRKGEVSTDKGLSFLEMKYHMLLSYLINLMYIVLRKCSGEAIERDPAIDRLVELRTILEKSRPIENKLKYQIDKLVKTAATGPTGDSDPIHFRANPANMVSKLNESEESDSESEDEKTGDKQEKAKKGVYVPPKLAAVYYVSFECAITTVMKVGQRNSNVLSNVPESEPWAALLCRNYKRNILIVQLKYRRLM